MLKFEHLNIATAIKVRRASIVTVILAVLFVVTFLAAIIICNGYKSLVDCEHKLIETQSATQELDTQLGYLTQKIAEADVKQSSVTNMEQLIIALGDCARTSGCAITSFSSNEAVKGSTVDKYDFTFEVQGTLSQIAKALSSLDDKGICYSVKGLSLRQVADYLWLQRDITDNITWWDLSDRISGGEATRTVISSEEILADRSRRFYINLEFIIVNNLV